MSRVQLALNVDDLETSIDFYSRLFGTEPAKVRPGYANFAVAEPPLKLVLIENPGQGGTLNHLGVEVADVATVDADPDPAARPRAWPPSTSAARPAATPSRTSSGSRAPRTASAGRSTPSWPTVRPPMAPRPSRRPSAAGSVGRAWVPPAGCPRAGCPRQCAGSGHRRQMSQDIGDTCRRSSATAAPGSMLGHAAAHVESPPGHHRPVRRPPEPC